MMRRLLPTVGRIEIVALCVFVALACTATIGQAAAVVTVDSSPTPWDLTLVDTGLQTSQSQITAYLELTYGITDELYKVGPEEAESGMFAGSYQTVFTNTPTDPSDATIKWVGPDYVTDPGYLLVKDGQATPAWYLFDLSDWNGQDTLSLTGFWPGSDTGAISHVTIYGSPGTPIPEPASLAVWSALGVFFGIGLYRRRRGQR